MGNSIEVIAITKKVLKKAIEDNSYWKQCTVPFSKSKANWLLSNDRIQEEDYCGIIAKEGDKMLSFIYLFPDYMNVSENETNKVYWMITWWVHEEHKNSVLGTYVFQEALNLTGKQILIKSYAENVTKFYEKQPFTVISSRFRYTIFFSTDTSILVGRFPFLKRISFLVDKVDDFVGWIIRMANKRASKKRTVGLVYNYVSQIDDELWNFIAPVCGHDLILKTKDYVNWQLNGQQYIQTPVGEKYPNKAIVAGISNNIGIHNYSVIKDEEIIGFISYIINYSEANVKYFLVKDKEYYNDCVDALVENIIRVNAKFLFTDDAELSNSLRKRYRTVFTHKVNKNALAHNETKIDFENVHLFNRDGHFY